MTSEQESEKAYRIRNEYMVHHADILLAVYGDKRSIRSGTGVTVNYAVKKNLPVIRIHPATVEVSQKLAL